MHSSEHSFSRVPTHAFGLNERFGLQVFISALALALGAFDATGQSITATFPQGCVPGQNVIVFSLEPCSGSANWTFQPVGGGTLITTVGCVASQSLAVGCYNVSASISGQTYTYSPGPYCVFNRPVPSFIVSQNVGCPGVCVEFSDTSDPGGYPGMSPPPYITTLNWNTSSISGCLPGNDSTFTCCIGTTGSFNVGLQVTSTTGCSNLGGIAQEVINVINNPPSPGFSLPTYLDCGVPVTMQSVNTSTGQAPLSYSWSSSPAAEFSDATASAPAIRFNDIGSYEVCLEVSNGIGCVEEICRTVEIFDTADLNVSIAPAPTCAGVNVTLSANPVPGPPSSTTWQVFDQNGDPVLPTPGSGLSVLYSFELAGNYTVVTTVSYSAGCIFTNAIPVEVFEPLVAAFSPGDTVLCTPSSLSFTNNSIGAGTLTYEWRVNGVIQGTGTDFTWSFNSTSTVELRVTNDIGCTASQISTITITPPSLDLTNIPVGACVGDQFCPGYILNVIPGETAFSFLWDFGDGTTSTDPNPCHAYTELGDFNVCLTITTESGCIANDCRYITIQPALNADFGQVPQNVCSGNGVSFEANNTDGTNYTWAFSGPCNFSINTGSQPFVNILPNCPGCFDVTLTISNLGCTASQTVAQAVCFYGPVALFNVIQSCDTPFVRTFQSTSIDADSLVWDFGDSNLLGGPADDPAIVNPSHTYQNEGAYQVCLTAYPTNFPDTCSYTRCTWVYIDVPSANVSFSPASGCPPLCVTFTPNDEPFNVSWNMDTPGGSPSSFSTTAFPAAPSNSPDPWNWLLSNSTWSNTWPIVPFHDNPFQQCVTYTNADTYSVAVSATNINGCIADTIYENIIEVEAAPDLAEFSVATWTDACGPDYTLVLTAQYQTLDSYAWEFRQSTGFGCIGQWEPFGTGQASETINFSSACVCVRLSVDQGACDDTSSQTICPPTIQQPTLSINDPTPCIGETGIFNSGAGFSGHVWTVNGVSVPGNATMSYVFPENGPYDISLTASDQQYGCTATIDQTVDVLTPQPQWSIDVTKDPTFCTYQVCVTDLSVCAGCTYSWTFIDINWSTVATCPNSSLCCQEFPIMVVDLLVTVTAPNGCAVTDTLPDLLDQGDVIGPWTWTPLDSVNCAPFCGELLAFNTDLPGYTYTWAFADSCDGTAGNGPVVQHCFTCPGSFCPTLGLFDPDGCPVSISCIEPIVVLPYEVSATTTAPICTGDCAPVLFTADNPDFGIDNIAFQPSSGVTPLVPQPPWEYDLCPTISTEYIVTANYYQCEAVVDVPVTVNPIPTLTFEPYGPFCINEGDLPLPVVAALPIGGSESWSLPAGFPDPEVLGPGCQHQIVYTYTDGNGCSNSIDIPFCIDDITVVPFLDSIHVCIDAPPLALGAFVGLADGSFYVLYDGSTWTPAPTAQFDPGLVIPPPTTAQLVGIRYHYTNAAGCISINDTVATVHPLPQLAVFAPEVCLYAPLTITNNSSITSGTVSEWTWLITGQGTFDMEQIPGLPYTGPDSVEIQLSAVSDRGCTATLELQTIVHPVPVAAFTISDACQYDTVPYTDLSTIEWNSGVDVIDQWDWRFGDGLGATGPNPTSHIWNNWGNTFTDTLIVTSTFGCRDTTTRTITIHPTPVNSMVFAPNCFGQCSPVQSTSTIPQGAIITTEWILEGSPYSGLSATHCFSTPDFHAITLLTESDQGCLTLTMDTIEVWPLPIPAFTPSVNELCVNDTLILNDISTIAPSPPYSLLQRQWWVDGQPYDTTTVISVIFPEAGSYAVGLVVTSATGCVDSLFTDGLITVHPLPIAGFTATPMRTGILQPDILFSDTSYLSVMWRYDLGDGSLSFDQNPAHTYATFGEFLIQQIVETEFGCLDTAWQTVIVDPDLLIYVPNTFTPDGDGINDVFMPSLDGFSLRNYEFTIWNRWGEQIFWTTDRQAGWDGTVNGVMSQDGVYIWQLEFRSNEFVGGKLLRGHVTLLR